MLRLVIQNKSNIVSNVENFYPKRYNSFKTYWLVSCLFLVVSMILVGGYTRLTGSGLSIVEWQPVSGVIPPMTDGQWHEDFEKYKSSPEYMQHNSNMQIGDFKAIFWVEFIHRLLGRITGLAFLLPLLYLLLARKIDRKDTIIYFSTLILFAFQGFMGWYMVKSGLVNEPYVSHWRLASHLIIAFIIYSLLYIQLMKNSFDILIVSPKVNLKKFKILSTIAIIVLFIQVFLGGLTAGLDGGLVYNSFPLMGDSFMPAEITRYVSIFEKFNDPVFIQFLHRMNAYLLIVITLILVVLFLESENNKLKIVAIYTFFCLVIQVVAGVFTLLYHVPIVLALIHQLGAVALLSAQLWGYYLLKNS